MTKEARMSMQAKLLYQPFRISSFVILSTFDIRHSSFYTNSGSSISFGRATNGVPSFASGYSKILPS